MYASTAGSWPHSISVAAAPGEGRSNWAMILAISSAIRFSFSLTACSTERRRLLVAEMAHGLLSNRSFASEAAVSGRGAAGLEVELGWRLELAIWRS